MPDRVPRLADLLAEQRQVVIRVRHARVGFERGLVAPHRFRAALEVFEQHGEVEVQQRVVAAREQGGAIGPLGVREPAALVQQQAEIGAGGEVPGIDRDRPLVRGARRLRVLVLERERAVEPASGVRARIRPGPVAARR